MKKAAYEFLPIYDRHVFYCNDIPTVKKLIKSLYKKAPINDFLVTDKLSCYGYVAPIMCKKDEDKVHGYVMYIKEGTDIGVVAHEATHLVNFIYDYIGQDLDVLNDEAQAYLTGYLTKQFMEKIRGVKTKSKALKG